jgi:hypothetical protein
LHIDLDEFLDLEDPSLDINTYMDRFADYDIIALCWKIFGDNGYEFWHGGNILDTFLMASDSPLKGYGVKTAFRLQYFDGAHPHRPKDPKVPVANLRACTSQGVEIETAPLEIAWATSMRIPEKARTWTGARINHYMHRSQDLATVTRLLRGDANGRKHRASKRREVGHKLYNEFNLNLLEDRAIRSTHAARQRVMNTMFRLPDVRKLHYAGIATHFARIASITAPVTDGDDPMR